MDYSANRAVFFYTRKRRREKTRTNMATPNLPQVRFPWRMAIYGIAILYIAADMYVFHGPLSKMIDRMYGRGIEEQIAKVPTGLVATVNTWPITIADLDRKVWEYCTVRGLAVDELDPKRLEVIRAVALNRLINDLAVWHYAKIDPVAVDDTDIDAAVAQVRGHFSNDETFTKRIAAQGMDAQGFRNYIADQVHQRKWLESKAAKHITVSEEEARAWYESDEDSRSVPERWRTRQIFMATLGKNPAEVQSAIGATAIRLSKGEITFEDAVEQLSEDQRSKKVGGDMGFFSRSRMPADFINAITGQEVGKLGQPFQTALGWHLIEITEHREAREAAFEEVRAEISAFLETRKRRDVIDQIVRDYRKRSKIWPPEPKP
ncbi:MAG: parvulin-like peptidyl-prolyl isomerase, partial [Pseudoalteromonas tetraodonis]